MAATGRLSSNNPNLQNIPIRTEMGREIRRAFIAEPGHKLLSADYSQIELRILAHISGEPMLLEAFRAARTSTPPRLPRCSARILRPDDRRRATAKIVNFGIVYGISPSGSPSSSGSRARRRRLIDHYFARFPHVQDFIHRTIEARRGRLLDEPVRAPAAHTRAARVQRQTRTLAERLAVNIVIQGTARISSRSR